MSSIKWMARKRGFSEKRIAWERRWDALGGVFNDLGKERGWCWRKSERVREKKKKKRKKKGRERKNRRRTRRGDTGKEGRTRNCESVGKYFYKFYHLYSTTVNRSNLFFLYCPYFGRTRISSHVNNFHSIHTSTPNVHMFPSTCYKFLRHFHTTLHIA